MWRNEVAPVEGKQCCYCCWWHFHLPTNIKTYFGTQNGLVRGNFCSMFGLGGFQIEIRLAFELGEAGRELSTAATDPKGLALSCSFHLGVLWLLSMWRRAAKLGSLACMGTTGEECRACSPGPGTIHKGDKQILDSELLEGGPHFGALG